MNCWPGAAVGCDRVACPRLTKGVASAVLIIRAGRVLASVEQRGERARRPQAPGGLIKHCAGPGQARPEQRIALTQRARPLRPLAIALIPAAPWVCRFLPCSQAQAESRNLGSNGNRRVYPIHAANFRSFNAADRAIAKSRGADQGAGQTWPVILDLLSVIDPMQPNA